MIIFPECIRSEFSKLLKVSSFETDGGSAEFALKANCRDNQFNSANMVKTTIGEASYINMIRFAGIRNKTLSVINSLCACSVEVENCLSLRLD